jgi:hypothetical protein
MSFQAEVPVVEAPQVCMAPVIRLNGVLYKRISESRFSQWRFLSSWERKRRMREYMRQWRRQRAMVNK